MICYCGGGREMFPQANNGDRELWISDSDFSGPNKALQIRGLGPDFGYPLRNSLFYSLGATSVHNYPFYSVAYFEHQEDCFRVIRELHQRVIFTTSEPKASDTKAYFRLKVEFTNKITPFDKEKDKKAPTLRPLNSNYLHTDRRSLPPSLDSSKFHFPPASLPTVKRISDILLTDPGFYKDVLLLMIQHNLKPPFDDLPNQNNGQNHTEDVNIPTSYLPFYKSSDTKHSTKRASKTESGIPEKRSKTTISENVVKVFETTLLNPRNSTKILFNIPLPVAESLPEPQESLPSTSGSFGTFTSGPEKEVKKVPTTSQFDLDSLSPTDFISSADLLSNRVTPEDYHNYPVFAKYSPGEPSQSLYVKNLHPRKVQLVDLYNVFTPFIDLSSPTHRNSFDIILLKSGKLRGQAFISLPSPEIASKALELCNGYILHDKPMVVSFSRNKTKVDDNG